MTFKTDEELNKIMNDASVFKRPWRDLPPTDKQVNYLAGEGESIPETRGECSDLIGKIIAQNKKQRRSRFTGTEPMGSGFSHYSHGVCDFIDDGNGNIWDIDEDYYNNDDGDAHWYTD